MRMIPFLAGSLDRKKRDIFRGKVYTIFTLKHSRDDSFHINVIQDSRNLQENISMFSQAIVEKNISKEN